MAHHHKTDSGELGAQPKSQPSPFVQKIDRILGVLETLVPPAVFAEYIAHVCGVSEKKSAVIAMVVAGVCAMIRWGWGVRHFFVRQFAVLISLALAVVVTHQFWQYRKLDEKYEALKNRVYKDPDPQVDWAIQSRPKIHDCSGKKDKDAEECFVQVLETFRPDSPPDLASDLRSAAILKRDNPKFTDWLRKTFGIDDRVIGTGYSLMWGARDFSGGRITEYSSPNLPDTAVNVWTWDLTSSQYHGRSLRTVLEKESPLANNPDRLDFKVRLPSDDFKRHLQLHDDMPVVVRFELLDPHIYTKCMGLHTARRVFTSNLGELFSFNVSPEDAEKLSGHNTRNVQGATEHLYIWVLAPQNPDQAVPATWNNFLTKIPAWMQLPPACP
jgi:hypothetical protein